MDCTFGADPYGRAFIFVSPPYAEHPEGSRKSSLLGIKIFRTLCNVANGTYPDQGQDGLSPKPFDQSWGKMNTIAHIAIIKVLLPWGSLGMVTRFEVTP